MIKTLIDSFRVPPAGAGPDVGDGGRASWRSRVAPVQLGRRVVRDRAGRVGVTSFVTRDAKGREEVATGQPLPLDPAGPRADPRHDSPCAGRGGRGGRIAQVPRLPDRRPDRRPGRDLPRQLDLHPRARGPGGPDPELQELVARTWFPTRPRPAWAWSTSASRATTSGRCPTRSWSSSAAGRSARIGLARREQVIDGCVVRMPKAYPVYDDDYQAHLARRSAAG